MSTRETGQALSDLLDLADRMRRSGGGDREMIRAAVDEAIARGEITMDDISIYRHMAIHAGVIIPTELERYRICPVCEARLDIPDEAA